MAPRPQLPARHVGLRAAALAVLAGTVGACSTVNQADQELRRSLLDSVRREAAEALRYPQTRETVRTARVPTLNLKPEVLERLEQTSGYRSYRGVDPGDLLAPPLVGGNQAAVRVSLERVIATTVVNNLDVQFARLGVVGREAALVQAQAAFDWVLFSNLTWSNIDEETISRQQFFPPTSRSFNQRQIVDTQVGLRRRMTSGGIFTIQQGLTYTDDTNEDFFNEPDPANESNLTIQIDQPLLRNFGSDVALAEVRLAANAQRDQIMQLKAQLLNSVTDAEQAYWRLVQAYGDYLFARRLLSLGVEVKNVLEARIRNNMDTNPAQYANAVAAVERRRADVIRAENTLRSRSDDLKLIINDAELTIGGETLVLPADEPLDAPFKFSLLDAITTAMARRPEVQRALLGIDDSSIRRRAAESGLLPQLDLRLQARFNALAGGFDTAISRQAEADLVDMLVGLVFEAPIGNRAAEGLVLSRRVEQQQAVLTHRSVVQRIVRDVKGSLRDVESNYNLIEQNHAARVAAAEDLRTTIEREPLQPLSPELLDLKLRKQEALASAESQELAALTGYNASIAALYGAIGTALERNRIRFEVATDVGEGLAKEARPGPDPILNLPPAPR